MYRRRNFLAHGGTLLAAAATPKSRVIVIGGGMAGATVAKYLRMWGDAIEVILIERSAAYTSNIMSSLVLTGQRSLSGLVYRYDTADDFGLISG